MTIAEVSKEFGLPIDTLRYYERIGLIPPVSRSKGGIRDYKDIDRKWIEYIKCMKGAGISIEALVEYVTLFQQGVTKTCAARKEILIAQRQLIADKAEEMNKVLAMLDNKIANYETICVEIVKSLDMGAS